MATKAHVGWGGGGLVVKVRGGAFASFREAPKVKSFRKRGYSYFQKQKLEN